MMRYISYKLVLAAFVGLMSLTGCGGSNGQVSGQVTYNGQPVAKGYISFVPTDGLGAVAGGPISNGSYTVADIPPGAKKVKVEAAEGGPSIHTTEDLAKFSQANKGKVKPSGIISGELIAQNAAGNNQDYTVTSGKQTLNVTITGK